MTAPIGSRAFEIVEALVKAGGELVTKDQLMERVWPGAIVEDNTLWVHMSAVRKALGPERGVLKTVAGVGYRLVGTWNVVQQTEDIDQPASHPVETVATPGSANNLPAAGTDLVGREQAVRELQDRLSAYRMVTLTGPGGIGKSRLALETAHWVLAQGRSEIWLVELASLSDPHLLPSAVATSLGLRIGAADLSAEVVARGMGQRSLLLLLDNCEHVVAAAAEFAEAVVHLCPRATILATSREVLRIDGEYIYSVPPLDVPGESAGPGDILSASAVQLFVARTVAVNSAFSLDRMSLREVARICQRLDGIPLAIEFAAARAATLGVSVVASHLHDRLNLLTAGRRTALARHQTLRAALDWSYGLLSEDEQRFFRALGIFAGGFTVEAAATVVFDTAQTDIGAIDRLADLVAKSLVVANVSGTRPRFRLLDTTRTYAIEKLDASGERERIARRHADYHRALFERAEGEVPERPASEWLADYAGELDNLRAALDWAFSPGGVESIGVALTVAAIPLWLLLPMVDECRRRVEQVFASAAREVPLDARSEMKLQAALGASLLFIKGAIPPVRQALTAAVRLAESLGDTGYQLRALSELWAHHTNTGELADALAVARRFHTLARDHADPAIRPIADRMMAMSYHYLGDQSNAWRYIELMIGSHADPRRRSSLIQLRFDQKVAGGVVLARILWLRGFADQAWRSVLSAVADAEALGDPATLCYALSHGGCLVALWVGNLAAAARYTDMLLDLSRRHGFAVWNDFAARLKGVVLVKTGDLDGGSPLLRAGLHEIAEPNVDLWFLTGLGQMAEALGQAGRFADGMATVERGLERSQRGWLAPELLRIKGELLLLQSTTGTTEAVEDVFRRALDGAREHESPSWELRAATSLARLLRDQRRPADAIACLQPVYDRFTEGFGTADLIAAKRLLDELGHRLPR